MEKLWLRGCILTVRVVVNFNNFIKEKILKIVKDKNKAKILTNFDHPFTAKRPTLNTNYYETFNRKNIELIDLKINPIIKITKKRVEKISRLIGSDVILGLNSTNSILTSISPL